MIDRKYWPPVITDKVIEAANSPGYYHEYPGFCLACGHEQANVEPDARRYLCEACGTRQVYGVWELLESIT
jgi:hypothetical protein